MKWFEGSINEAVAASKSRRAVFVVFVEGKDETSTQVAEAINDSEVSSRLERDEFVAVRLESGSESYVFFAQIYKLVPVPSLFFIGENGIPLEIVAGSTTPADLITKIDLVLSKAGKSKNTSLNLINAEQEVAAANNTTNNTNVNKEPEDSNQPQTKAEIPVPQTASTSVSSNATPTEIAVTKEEPSTSLKATEPPKPVDDTKEPHTKESSTEDKVEKARQMMEMQRKQRIEEEERKEKERELERKKKREMQSRKEKQQELTDREKIRQQIAQDKIERKQKELALQQQIQQQHNQELPKPYTPAVTDATITRIQFRLPSGNPHMGQFEPTSTLRSLRTYVVQNIALPFRQFAMSTSFPRRELTDEDDDKTLLELELVPTAVILILPLKNSNISAAVTSTQDFSLMPQFVWSMFAVVSQVYRYVISYFTGNTGDDSREQQGNSSENKDATSNSGGTIPSNTQSGLVRRYVNNRDGATVKAEGNIHRLHSGGDDNDENNTWNGNSTQQM